MVSVSTGEVTNNLFRHNRVNVARTVVESLSSYEVTDRRSVTARPLSLMHDLAGMLVKAGINANAIF